MKLYAPEYYKKFTCIADRCRHSCCIGWEIDIDGDAIKKYSQSRLPYAEKIINSIEKGADSNHFRLCDGRRCAHLDSRGLCKIIIECGEDYLCDICREHPRFYNYTARGAEVGLGMSCEAAAKLILSSDGYAEINEIGELYGEPDFFEFDSNKQITELFSILADRSIGYSERLSMIYNKYNVSPSVLSDGEWRELLFSLEYMLCILQILRLKTQAERAEDTRPPRRHLQESDISECLSRRIYGIPTGSPMHPYESRDSFRFHPLHRSPVRSAPYGRTVQNRLATLHTDH